MAKGLLFLVILAALAGGFLLIIFGAAGVFDLAQGEYRSPRLAALIAGAAVLGAAGAAAWLAGRLMR